MNNDVQPSLSEILQSASALYTTWNGRPMDLLLPHDTIEFITDPYFFPFLQTMMHEISELSGAPISSAQSFEQLVDWLSRRGYNVVFTFGALAEKAIFLRQTLLFAVMNDLLTERLVSKKGLVAHTAVQHVLFLDNDSLASARNAAHLFLQAPRDDNDILGTVKSAIQEAYASRHNASRSFEQLCDLTSIDQSTRRVLDRIVLQWNEEYRKRQRLLLKRLDVSLHSFLWTPKMKKCTETRYALYNIVQQVFKWRMKLQLSEVHLWDAVTLGPTALKRQTTKTQQLAVPCALRRVIIGDVADRGGIPEGYAVDPIRPGVPRADRMPQRSTKGSRDAHQPSSQGRRRRKN